MDDLYMSDYLEGAVYGELENLDKAGRLRLAKSLYAYVMEYANDPDAY